MYPATRLPPRSVVAHGSASRHHTGRENKVGLSGADSRWHLLLCFSASSFLLHRKSHGPACRLVNRWGRRSEGGEISIRSPWSDQLCFLIIIRKSWTGEPARAHLGATGVGAQRGRRRGRGHAARKGGAHRSSLGSERTFISLVPLLACIHVNVCTRNLCHSFFSLRSLGGISYRTHR